MSFNKSAPLTVGGTNVWKGTNKTNGFCMRSADGRIPATKQSFLNLYPSDHSSCAVLDGTIPFGTGLFRDSATFANGSFGPGRLYVRAANIADTAIFAGILEFNQGMATGHPIDPIGLKNYMKGEIISSGYVGYKSFMPPGDRMTARANYAAWLNEPEDPSLNAPTHRHLYSDICDRINGDAPQLVGLMIDRETGFPFCAMMNPANTPYSSVEDILVGFAEVYEPENETIYFKLDPFCDKMVQPV